MSFGSDSLQSVILATAEPLALALIGMLLLWVVVKLRRLSESWRGAQGIPMRPAERGRRPKAVAGRSVAAANASLIIGALFLLSSTAYLSLRMIPEVFQYFELKNNLTRGRQAIRSATWRDPALQCPNGEPLGVQLHRLFLRPQIYLLDVRWDTLPPHYEIVVSGQTPLVEDTIKRDFELLVLVSFDGSAELGDATLLGEAHAIEPARKLLVAACGRSLAIVGDTSLSRIRRGIGPQDSPIVPNRRRQGD